MVFLHIFHVQIWIDARTTDEQYAKFMEFVELVPGKTASGSCIE